MPDQTPKLGIPYPLPADAVTDYPGVGQDLAETLEALFADFPTCKVSKSSDTAVPSGQSVYVPFDLERWDPWAMHDPAVNPTRVTAPKAGLYLVTANLFLSLAVAPAAGSPGMQNYARLRARGNLYFADQSVSFLGAGTIRLTFAGMVVLNVGDYVELGVFNSTGQTMTVAYAVNSAPDLGVAYLGPSAPTLLQELLDSLRAEAEPAPAG